MQAKNVPDIPVLKFLESLNGHWANWVGLETERDFEPMFRGRSVLHAMPEGTLPKVALAKMRSLMKRGFVKGCSCGCRGDFEITQEGLQFIRTTELRGQGKEKG